jgi:hypothetical protein
MHTYIHIHTNTHTYTHTLAVCSDLPTIEKSKEVSAAEGRNQD